MIINNYARCEFFHSLVIICHSFLPDTMVNYRQVNYSPVMIYCGYWPLFLLDCCHISEWQWRIMLQTGCERKEKSSLKCKTERAANLGKLQNGKGGENCSLYATHPLLPPSPPLLWAIETALMIKPMNSEKHIHICPPQPCFVWYQATTSCHKLWILWNRVCICINFYSAEQVLLLPNTGICSYKLLHDITVAFVTVTDIKIS